MSSFVGSDLVACDTDEVVAAPAPPVYACSWKSSAGLTISYPLETPLLEAVLRSVPPDECRLNFAGFLGTGGGIFTDFTVLLLTTTLEV